MFRLHRENDAFIQNIPSGVIILQVLTIYQTKHIIYSVRSNTERHDHLVGNYALSETELHLILLHST